MAENGLAHAIFSIHLCDSLCLETASNQSFESLASCCKPAYIRFHLHQLVHSHEGERNAVPGFCDESWYLVSGFGGYHTLNVTAVGCADWVEDYCGLREKRLNP